MEEHGLLPCKNYKNQSVHIHKEENPFLNKKLFDIFSLTSFVLHSVPTRKISSNVREANYTIVKREGRKEKSNWTRMPSVVKKSNIWIGTFIQIVVM